ncbi:hypothetical protein AXF42_Ash005300 [Apostasia shenzhenica]|uniref:Uncharacterized protein n=1 Tax=Apostasia shenzhenica TaxID=1088818 RepID=A0A2I0B6J7_9ASPA|nr:hypothetical protein AXF42_Ash005300 [Apostasia shenzhenica]
MNCEKRVGNYKDPMGCRIYSPFYRSRTGIPPAAKNAKIYHQEYNVFVRELIFPVCNC